MRNDRSLAGVTRYGFTLLRAALFGSLVIAWAGHARADVSLHQVFTDHAVLQRAASVPIWGKAQPGERITVTIDNVTAQTTTDASGRWRVKLDLQKLGQGPFSLKVTGKNTITLKDVLIGQVWLCSGQSNMEWLLRDCTHGKEDAQQTPTTMRFFVVNAPAAIKPMDEFQPRAINLPVTANQWQPGSPEASAYFSGVGYHFGRTLSDKLGEPIGLINASWGGTVAEAWTSGEGLDKDPDLKAGKEKSLNEVISYPSRWDKYLADYANWEAKYRRQDKPLSDVSQFASPGASTKSWKPVELPGQLTQSGLGNPGAIWFRQTVQVGPRIAGKPMKITLGILHGADTVYWNGEKAGETAYGSPGINNHRLYEIPKNLVKEGENTIAVRLFNPIENTGLDSRGAPTYSSPISLFGSWVARMEYEMPPLATDAVKTFPSQPINPPKIMATGLFNGMIHPLLPYAIKGVVWYQGESNTPRAYQYRTAFPLLIQDWRAHWAQGDFPFYFCELGGEGNKKPNPEPFNFWGECRESQRFTLGQPNTGMAVTMDLSERDVHYRNKKPAGERLAVMALAKTYGMKVSCLSPLYKSMQVQGNTIRVQFNNTDGGLVAKPLPSTWQPDSTIPETIPLGLPSPGSEVQGFAICGKDRQWQWAKARIDGESVVVWSDSVADPVAVRYAWANNPTCNLWNGAGFPAASFRTDDFPIWSRTAKYEGY